jgi:hypothetical protein
MSTTIDHLRVDHWVTVLQDLSDGEGKAMRAGERGILRGLSFDQVQMTIHMEIACESERVSLRFPLRAEDGPRNGHMKEYFALGEYAPTEAERERVTPSPPAPVAAPQTVAPEKPIEGPRDPDRLVEEEEELLRKYDHIGVAASIAEMYAERMRAFRAEGNEPRAVAAFELAIQWMSTYAGWATSGGEGAALSYERDQFHAQLVRELGYDPSAQASS